MTEIIKPSRRGFITGAVSLLVAPAIVRIENLMPVKAYVNPEDMIKKLTNYFCVSNPYPVDVLYGMFMLKYTDGFQITKIPMSEIYTND
jgi:hypothetical protein